MRQLESAEFLRRSLIDSWLLLSRLSSSCSDEKGFWTCNTNLQDLLHLVGVRTFIGIERELFLARPIYLSSRQEPSDEATEVDYSRAFGEQNSRQ